MPIPLNYIRQKPTFSEYKIAQISDFDAKSAVYTILDQNSRLN